MLSVTFKLYEGIIYCLVVPFNTCLTIFITNIKLIREKTSFFE